MKIWILQDRLRSGGTERQTILLAGEFASAGHLAEVVTFRPGGVLSLTLAPLVPHALQPFDTGLNWFAPGLLRAARRAAPDVVLCMGRMANCHSGRLARALPETTVIGTLRTGKKLPPPFRRSLAAVAHIVANSHESAALLARAHGVPAAKISVIHNALVFPAEQPPQAAAALEMPLRATLGATGQTVVLLCVGMFRPEKNQAGLIRAAARLAAAAPSADWQLWLAGDGPERARCERLASAEPAIAKRVHFLGFQSDPAAAYREADLAVLTSRSESLSNFLIEAQAHGLPVVASEAGGVSECLIPGVTGEVTPAGDEDTFVNALRAWIADPGRRLAAAAPAREFARKAFSPARQAGAYLHLFKQLRNETRAI
jgi:glycosyltransferase involved in cell wall biosynthesis